MAAKILEFDQLEREAAKGSKKKMVGRQLGTSKTCLAGKPCFKGIDRLEQSCHQHGPVYYYRLVTPRCNLVNTQKPDRNAMHNGSTLPPNPPFTELLNTFSIHHGRVRALQG